MSWNISDDLKTVGSGMVKVRDKRWDGKWQIASDLDELLVFSIVATLQRPDIVIWNEERKIVHLLELTVLKLLDPNVELLVG